MIFGRLYKMVDAVFLFALMGTLGYAGAFTISHWLVWIVPACWTALIQYGSDQRGQSCKDWPNSDAVVFIKVRNGRDLGSRFLFYAKIWASGFALWVTPSIWLQFDTWWPYAVWVAFSIPLGLFWVVFIGLSRIAVLQMRIPTVFVAPVVWCAIEWVRKRLFLGGISVGALEHAIYENTTIIQVADIGGEYAVGMLIVFTGTTLGRFFSKSAPVCRPRQCSLMRLLDSRIFALGSCAMLLAAVVAYGHNRIAQIERVHDACSALPGVRIALLQGDTKEHNPLADSTSEWQVRFDRVLRQLSPEVDLVVWPECSVPLRLYEFEQGYIPREWDGQPTVKVETMLREVLRNNHRPFHDLAMQWKTDLLLGVTTSVYRRNRNVPEILRRNSAVFVDLHEGVGPRYDKVNLAPLGERNPLASFNMEQHASRSRFSPGSEESIVPIMLVRKVATRPPDSLTMAEASLQASPLWASVNICFDSTIPQFIRRQIRASTNAGKEPSVIINLSDDSIFGYLLAELHLASHVFRAIESRKPYLTATNGGYSAWIASTGKIVEKGKRNVATCVIAEIRRISVASVYLTYGDLFPICCVCCNLFVVFWWITINRGVVKELVPAFRRHCRKLWSGYCPIPS